jgi:transposase
MIDRTREMIKLKQEGATYRKIAEMFGISYQRVYQIIGKQNISYFKEVTEEQCVFKGIRDYMNNTQTSLAEIIRKIYGGYHASTCQRFRYYLNGKNEMSMSTINAILDVIGLTYEEAFRRD